MEAALRGAQAVFESVQATLGAHRDALDDRIVENMLAGYAYVDEVVAGDVDVLALGNLKHLLELNTLVLCGTSEPRRQAHAGHLAATERRFYEEREAGVQDVVEWYELHADDSPWLRAVGLYIRMLSAPQLFIEGNHRTGALVMSWVLLRDGLPPFVLTAENAADYFRASALARQVPKHGLWASIRAIRLRRHGAALLRQGAYPRFLAPAA